MAAIAVRMLAFIAAAPEKRAPLRRIASINAALQNAQSSRTTTIPVQPQSLAVAILYARLAALREAEQPPRSLVAAIAGGQVSSCQQVCPISAANAGPRQPA
jgi:hypothetical protein